MPVIPDLNALLSGDIGEGQRLDFKSEINLDDKESKASIVDDVVAFLNADGGQILVGVQEDRKSATVRLNPLIGNVDSICLRLQDAIKSNIAPSPAQLTVDAVPVAGGFILCVDLGVNINKPYCNKITGRYLQRRGRKNEPLLPGELRALQETRSTVLDRLVVLSKEYRENLKTDGLMTLDCPELHISLLPLEHFNPQFPGFDVRQGGYGRKGFVAPHGPFKAFERVAGGHDVFSVDMHGNPISRFFVGDDWLIHSVICHPIPFEKGEGRVNFKEMEAEIGTHLLNVRDFLHGENLQGPFAVEASVVNLHSRDHFRMLFPRAKTITMGRPAFWETFEPDAIAY